MYVAKGIKAQPIPQRWFVMAGSIRLDGRYWTRVADKLVKAGYTEFEAIEDEVVKRAIALVEGEDSRQRRMVMIERVINGTPPGQKRPPPRKVATEARSDGKHRGLGPAPEVLNAGIRDTGPKRQWSPRLPKSLMLKPDR